MLGKFRKDRQEQRRLAALAELERRELQLRPAYKVWGYKNVFAKGFLVTRSATAQPPRDNWVRAKVGSWHIVHDPELEVQVASHEADPRVAVLGHAFAEGGPRQRGRVAQRLQRAARSGRDAVEDEVTWLSGRYVVLVDWGDELDVYNDPLATRACYWHRTADDVVLASHTALIAQHVGGLGSEQMWWALRHPDYRSPAGRWIPGLITSHDGVEQVYANGRLTVGKSRVTHSRFFPKHDREELPLTEATEQCRDALREQIKNWTQVAPITTLALTAGHDSRAILDAGLDILQANGALAMTYHPFHVPGKSTYADVEAANRLAAAARLPHLVLDVAPRSPASVFAKFYEQTFPTYRRYENLANALYLRVPARSATLFGVGGAVITGMYADTSDTNLTPQLLARKYAQSAFGNDPRLHEVFENWMQRTDFSAEQLRGYSFYDFFHWEHRMSKWGAEGYNEYDLATIPAPVLSSRRLLVAALSLPEELRRGRAIYDELRREPEPTR